MRLHPTLVLFAAASLAAAPAPDTYTLKLKHDPDPGKSIVIKDNQEQTSTVRVLDVDGKLLKEDKPEEAKEEVYTETVLEKGDKHPKKFTRAFAKATRTVNGKTSPRSYQGRTVVFELKDGKYEVTAEGEPPLAPKDREDLAQQVNKAQETPDEVLLPKAPVKVGDRWPIDNKALAKSFAQVGQLDAEKTRAEATLVKAYQKDGRQYGVIEVTMKLAIRRMPNLKFDPPASMDLKTTLDAVIDGSSPAGVMKMEGKLNGKTSVSQEGMTFTIDMHVETSGSQEHSPEQPAK
jgi:hypothetical protein